MEEFNLTFDKSWLEEEPLFQEEYCNEYKLRILEDLGESWDWVETDDGTLEWAPVHKYKVKKL